MRTVNESYVGAAEITPSDTDSIRPTRAIMVGVSGDVMVTMQDGSEALLSGLNAGVVYPVSVTMVHDTDTTATDIIGLY